MSLVRPIPVCLPTPGLAAEVATPPLGALTVSEWLAMLEGKANSFVHVIRGGVDTAEGGPDEAAARATGRVRLEQMLAEGVVAGPADPAFYVYRIDGSAGSASAVVGEVRVEGYADGRIRRHEDTRAPTEDLLAEHLLKVAAHTDPVSLAYPADPGIERVVGEVTATAPLLDFTTDDGTRQRVWRVGAGLEPELQRRLDGIGTLYVTDGHHRIAAAARYARWRTAHRPGTEPDPGYRFVLAALFADRALTLFEFNRCVADVGDVDALVSRIGERLAVAALGPDEDPRPRVRGSIGMVGGGCRWMLTVPPELVPDDAYGALDAVLLQELVLGPCLGITDPRTDRRLRYVAGPGIADPTAHGCDVCFLLHPTDVADVLAVAAAGQVMPPKSTWFEPKVWGGVFIRLL